jgi:hypothetical protein
MPWVFRTGLSRRPGLQRRDGVISSANMFSLTRPKCLGALLFLTLLVIALGGCGIERKADFTSAGIHEVFISDAIDGPLGPIRREFEGKSVTWRGIVSPFSPGSYKPGKTRLIEILVEEGSPTFYAKIFLDEPPPTLVPWALVEVDGTIGKPKSDLDNLVVATNDAAVRNGSICAVAPPPFVSLKICSVFLDRARVKIIKGDARLP